jgi:hypothetical protein
MLALAMRRLRRLFRRSPIKLGYIDEHPSETTPIRNAQFVSFFAESDCKPRRHAAHHDTRLRRQKLVKYTAILAITALAAWFVIESAQAISAF